MLWIGCPFLIPIKRVELPILSYLTNLNIVILKNFFLGKFIVYYWLQQQWKNIIEKKTREFYKYG